MKDLFEREQQIFDAAFKRSDTIGAEYEALAIEYGRLLKQLRRVTRISDKTAVNLNSSNLDLLDKVHFDQLTGIYNRRYLDERLSQLVKTLSRAGGKLSVMMIDIDFFKKYNDAYGHDAGDKCLIAVAQALSNGISREDDFIARYGGEEFTAVLPGADEAGARAIARRLLDTVRALGIAHEQSSAASSVTISIGVTSGEANHVHKGTQFIKRADQALYMSKQNGRNKYTYLDFEEAIT